jgi:hypothetical protein
MRVMRRLAWAIPVALFLLDPSFACGPAEPQYQYGAAEMRAAVEGTWSFTILPDGATTPVQVTVQIAQAASAPGAQARARGRGLVRAAHACGNRTLVKSAAACIDSTTMPLEVRYLAGDASFATAALSGTFEVMSLVFETGSTRLELVLGDYHLESEISPGGTLVNPQVAPTGAAGSLTIVTRS